MTSIRRWTLAVGLVCVAQTVAAQAAPVALRGVAYDSLRSAPLADAAITLVGGGTPRLATTDSRGRFRFDSVAPGPYTLHMLHAVLDSIGFSGIQTRVAITDGSAEARLAIPSFATIWKATCGDRPAPRDSAIVFGSVRFATDRSPATDATVLLTWLDLEKFGRRTVQPRRFLQETKATPSGTYGICGVPEEFGLRLIAGNDTAASGVVDVLLGGLRVRRVDVLIASVTDTVTRGAVTGFITDSAGNPFPNARVRVDGAPEARTADDGRFRVASAPLGTRRLEVNAIGVAPVETTVDVVATDTLVFLAQLKRVTILDVIRVTASRQYRAFVADLEDRRKAGIGYFRDSTEVGGWGTLMGVFNGFPSTEVRQMGRGAIGEMVVLLPGKLGGRCVATVWIDNRPTDYSELSMLRPEDFAVVEVYPRAILVPLKFQRVNSDCGVVVVWTKRGLPR